MLDKITTIVSENRGNQQFNFIAITTATIFAWNMVTIGNTDAIRSIVTICRPLSFPLDVELVKYRLQLRTQSLILRSLAD